MKKNYRANWCKICRFKGSQFSTNCNSEWLEHICGTQHQNQLDLIWGNIPRFEWKEDVKYSFVLEGFSRDGNRVELASTLSDWGMVNEILFSRFNYVLFTIPYIAEESRRMLLKAKGPEKNWKIFTLQEKITEWKANPAQTRSQVMMGSAEPDVEHNLAPEAEPVVDQDEPPAVEPVGITGSIVQAEQNDQTVKPANDDIPVPQTNNNQNEVVGNQAQPDWEQQVEDDITAYVQAMVPTSRCQFISGSSMNLNPGHSVNQHPVMVDADSHFAALMQLIDDELYNLKIDCLNQIRKADGKKQDKPN